MAGFKQQRTAAQKAEIKRQCYEMRLKGWSVRKVAAELGIGIATVSRYCKEQADEIVLPLAEEFRQYQDEQLDAMFKSLQEKIGRGDTRAIEMGIKILERRSKLYGLDKPTVVEQNINVTTETDRQIAELTRQMLDANLAEKFTVE